MIKKPRMLILDFDGVISDSFNVCKEEINRLVSSFPSIPYVETQDDMTTLYSVELRHSLYRFGLDDELTKNFFDQHSEAMKRRAKEVEPFHDVVRALSLCEIPKVIVTSSYSVAVYDILQKCRDFDSNLVQAVYGREQRKTKTEKIRNALGTFEVDMTEALYVGDLASDILYCKDVPINIASVGYGYHPSWYLQNFSPERILKSVEDFVEFLESSA